MLTRQGIVDLLDSAGIDVVAQAGDADAAARSRSHQTGRRAGRHQDAPGPTDEGLVAARTIRVKHPGTVPMRRSGIRDAADRTASRRPGYSLKEQVFDVAVLVDALRRVRDGETVITRRSSPGWSGVSAATTRSGPCPIASVKSSPRRGGPVKPRRCHSAVHHRAHRRGAYQAHLHQVRIGRVAGRPPPGPRCTHPAALLTSVVAGGAAAPALDVGAVPLSGQPPLLCTPAGLGRAARWGRGQQGLGDYPAHPLPGCYPVLQLRALLTRDHRKPTVDQSTCQPGQQPVPLPVGKHG